jgi:predicted ABC-type ATPase
MSESHPVCTIIAGPNGAGKTTFALNYLPQVAQCHNFINADLIAAGLSPFSPERHAVMAGKLFLREINKCVAKRESFAFESTIAGKSYLSLVKNLLEENWQVNLIYLWLPSADAAVIRVAERVLHGGHHIPHDAIIRRYARSVHNLLDVYAPLCSYTICYENSTSVSVKIFEQDRRERRIFDKDLYEKVLFSAGKL